MNTAKFIDLLQVASQEMLEYVSSTYTAHPDILEDLSAEGMIPAWDTLLAQFMDAEFTNIAEASEDTYIGHQTAAYRAKDGTVLLVSAKCGSCPGCDPLMATAAQKSPAAMVRLVVETVSAGVLCSTLKDAVVRSWEYKSAQHGGRSYGHREAIGLLHAQLSELYAAEQGM